MKKFHKRVAVFLTAATLAGLPAGAFFYSSPGSLTVWADNVEVESSEESSPEDVDFSDGSEVEIHADPVEQAQEDAGNDVTETPEVGITFTEPEGWQTDTATVKIQVEDTKNTGAFSIAKVEARLSENGGWSDITGNMEVSISSNCSIYVRVTDQNGNTYEQNRYIECFDKTKPTIIAAAKNGILIVQGVDAESGIAALYVNGNEFTELTNNTLNVRLQKADTSYEYFTLQAKDKAGNMSEIYKVGNPYYENPDAVKENTEVSGTEQNAASLPADGTASKPTSATATVTEHQTTNETATAPTEPENTGNETDTEADTGRVQGESSASGMSTGTVQDKGGKEFYTIKTKSDKVFYLIVDKDKTDENVYLLTEVGENDLLNFTDTNMVTLPQNQAIAESALPLETEKITETPEPEVTIIPEEKEEPEKKSNNSGTILLMLLVLAGGGQVFLCGQGGRRRICRCFCWQRFGFRFRRRCWRWCCQGYDLNSRRQVRCRCGFRFCVTFVGRRFIGLGAGCLQAAKVADHVVDRAGEARYVGQVFEGISPHLYLGPNLFALGNYDSELVVLFFHGCCPFWFVGVTSFLALLRR